MRSAQKGHSAQSPDSMMHSSRPLRTSVPRPMHMDDFDLVTSPSGSPTPQQQDITQQDMSEKYSTLLMASNFIHKPLLRLADKTAVLLGGHHSGPDALFVQCVCGLCLGLGASGECVLDCEGPGLGSM